MAERQVAFTPNAQDMHSIGWQVRKTKADDDIRRITLGGVAPVAGTKTAMYGTSVLLNAGEKDLEGRTHLIVRNPSPDTEVKLGPTSQDAIYEYGIALGPKETIDIAMTASVPVYARAMGYPVELEVIEC